MYTGRNKQRYSIRKFKAV
ncbi:YSIRK-type signal peptide-containing protein [Treponema sp.]